MSARSKLTASEWLPILTFVRWIIEELAHLRESGQITLEEEARQCEITIGLLSKETPEKVARWDNLIEDIRAGREAEK